MNVTEPDNGALLIQSIAKVKKYIYLYYSPFLFLGVFGNIITLLLLIKQGRQLSHHLIPMIFIAFGDCGTLLTALIFDRFITEGVGVPSLAISSMASCKTIAYFWGIFNAFAANMIVIVALDRYLAISHPIWHRTVTKKQVFSLCGSFTIAVGLIGILLPVHWVNIQEYQVCYISPMTSTSTTVGLQLLIILFYNGCLSSCILIVLDIIIVKNLLTNGYGREVQRIDRKAAANLLIMAIAFLISTIPRCCAFTASFFYGYVFFSFSKSMIFFEVAKILDVFFYTYCALNWSIYVVRFKLLNKAFRINDASISVHDTVQ